MNDLLAKREIKKLASSMETFREMWKEENKDVMFCTTCGLPCTVEWRRIPISECCGASVSSDPRFKQ